MSPAETWMWYGLAAAAMVGSALCSGIETGCYTINRVRLHVLAHAPGSNAAVLERLLERPDRLLGTLLIANNLVNYLASISVAALLTAAGYSDWGQVAVSAAILTPMILIFGEVLPKDFFRSNADTVTPLFARPVRLLAALLTITGVLPLISLFSSTVRRALSDAPRPGDEALHPRRIVGDLIREGVGHGVITPYQSNMIERVMASRHMKVRQVMVPWSDVTTARESQPVEALWALADRVAFSRVPLLGADGQPIGTIDLNDVLRHDPDRCPPLRDLALPLARIDAGKTLRAALRHLQRERASIALVTDGAKPIGVVTAKDLLEPIVGEVGVW